MVVDEQEFRAFLANIENLFSIPQILEDEKRDAEKYFIIEAKIYNQLYNYKVLLNDKPIKSKWKQLQLPINQ